MNNKEIMVRVIEQAEANHYVCDSFVRRIYEIGVYEPVIFSPDFARAFWGVDRYCLFSDGELMSTELSQADYDVAMREDNYWEYCMPYWKYMLQNLVVSDDSAAFLASFLDTSMEV